MVLNSIIGGAGHSAQGAASPMHAKAYCLAGCSVAAVAPTSSKEPRKEEGSIWAYLPGLMAQAGAVVPFTAVTKTSPEPLS